jgi:hypothetical protein
MEAVTYGRKRVRVAVKWDSGTALRPGPATRFSRNLVIDFLGSLFNSACHTPGSSFVVLLSVLKSVFSRLGIKS